MVDIESIKSYYETAPTGELIELSQYPEELRTDILPILRAELKKRNEIGAIENLDSLLSKDSTKTIDSTEKSLNRNELLTEIDNRILNGETIESIRIDLNERGISITEIFDENGIYAEEKFDERIIREIAERRLKNEDYGDIQKDIVIREGITEEQADSLVNETLIRGKKNMERGAIVFIIGCIVTACTFMMSYENGGYIIIAYGAIVSGAAQYFHGLKQSKKNN